MLDNPGLSDPWNVGVNTDALNNQVLYPIPSEVMHIVNAVDYGVVADDQYDDTKAMISVIAAAKAFNGELTQINLPGGQLDFIEGMNDQDPSVGILFEDMSNIVLAGNSTSLVFHGDFRAIEFQNCTNILTAGISIDWGRPPFSMGVITKSDGKTFEIQVDNGYPVDASTAVKGLLEYDPATNTPRVNGNDIYGDVDRVLYLGSQKLLITFKTDHAVAPVGTIAILRHHIYEYDGIIARNSNNMKFEGVTIYTAPGMGFLGYSSEDLYFNRFNIKLRDDTDRMMSTTADGMHCMDCGGDLQVTNSIFENTGDDALNAHGAYLTINQKIDSTTVYAFNPRGYNFKPEVGDSLEFERASTLKPTFSANVVSITDHASGNGFDIQVDQPIPDTVAIGDVIANATRTPKLVFKNNLVRNKRARGVLVQTRDARIENNTFANNSSGAVFIYTDSNYWYESLSSRDVIVKNNKMVGNNFGPSYIRTDGDISAVAWASNSMYGATGVFNNLAIENNFIANTGNAGVYIISSDDVNIAHNLISKSGLDAKSAHLNSGIGLAYSKNVTVEKNSVIPNSTSDFKPLSVGAGLDLDTFNLISNEGIDSSDIGSEAIPQTAYVEKIPNGAIDVADTDISDWGILGNAVQMVGFTGSGLSVANPDPEQFKVNQVKLAHDDDNIYFNYDVTDHNLSWISGNYWQGSGVEIFATDNLASDDPMEIVKNTNDSSVQIFMGGTASGGSFLVDVRTSSSVYANRNDFKLNLWEKPDGKGYQGEGLIPLKDVPSIQEAIEDGKEIKLTIRFAYLDNNGSQVQVSNAAHPVEFNKYISSRMPAVKFGPVRSTAATLTSTIGTVSTAGTTDETITNIPYGTSLDAFKAAITPAANATFDVYDEDGTTVATTLATGKKLIVTAEDGTTKVTYTVTVNAANTAATLSALIPTSEPAATSTPAPSLPTVPTDTHPVLNSSLVPSPADVQKAIKQALVSAPTIAFPDVKSNSWSARGVKLAAQLGIIAGKPDGQFHGDANVTRAEFATMIVRALRMDISHATSNGAFTDTQGHWADSAIAVLRNAGILNGAGDGFFKPDQAISRSEIAAILARVMSMTSATTSSFSDTSNSWAQQAIEQLYNAGIVSGTGGNQFKPDDKASRNEAVAIVVRMLNKTLELGLDL
ncbi:S-layer homology domain-containing protein [Paenibacillus sp. PAMC21692]|uniref:S-layer homology domain-containing protein n=1 Tax=Paenibacillus sp. PAMC21692 TaxID=2762320 RepID=UPI00164CF098|nr:S-layer homology domain-containing protein [Paenibacillus sp. PAMC21692]QNK56674.1 S-layer homology domain-containing protein [Paenibacillus sp. PAMC21692]